MVSGGASVSGGDRLFFAQTPNHKGPPLCVFRYPRILLATAASLASLFCGVIILNWQPAIYSIIVQPSALVSSALAAFDPCISPSPVESKAKKRIRTRYIFTDERHELGRAVQVFHEFHSVVADGETGFSHVPVCCVGIQRLAVARVSNQVPRVRAVHPDVARTVARLGGSTLFDDGIQRNELRHPPPPRSSS